MTTVIIETVRPRIKISLPPCLAMLHVMAKPKRAERDSFPGERKQGAILR